MPGSLVFVKSCKLLAPNFVAHASGRGRRRVGKEGDPWARRGDSWGEVLQVESRRGPRALAGAAAKRRETRARGRARQWCPCVGGGSLALKLDVAGTAVAKMLAQGGAPHAEGAWVIS